MGTDNFIVFRKVFVDIKKAAERRFDTSSYELESSLPTRKIKK